MRLAYILHIRKYQAYKNAKIHRAISQKSIKNLSDLTMNSPDWLFIDLWIFSRF